MSRYSLRIVDEDVVDPSELMANPRNWRIHPREQREALEEVLGEIGWVQRVIVNKRTGNLVDGHLRVDLAIEREEMVPVGYVDLSEEEEAKILATIDPLSSMAVPDSQKMDELLPDVEIQNEALRELLNEIAGRETLLNDAADVAQDSVGSRPDEPDTKVGDVFELGPHRLVCGDASDPEITKVLPECAAMWTDPPYGDPLSPDQVDLDQEEIDDGKVMDLLSRVFRAARLVAGAPFYVSCPASPRIRRVLDALTRAGWAERQMLVWVIENNAVLGRNDYHFRHVNFLSGYTPREGAGRLGRGGDNWCGDNAQDSVFEFPRPMQDEHPTMKPPELITEMLRNSVKGGNQVYEPFAGSGSTMVACETLGLSCQMIELDPGYCDVIRQRWERLEVER